VGIRIPARASLRADYVETLKFVPSQIKKIALIANAKHTVDDSNVGYLPKLVDYLKELGFSVSHRKHDATPDEDVMYIAEAGYFLQGGGGFSKLLAGLVESNRGKVIRNNYLSSFDPRSS